MGNRIVHSLIVLLALTAFPSVSQASFHLWRIKEVYSNADGRVQFIELIVPSATDDGETQLNGKTIVVTAPGGGTNTFTFNSNLTAPTGGKHLLIATPGFAAIPGAPSPDFTLPCGPFFDKSAPTITITFANGQDTMTILQTPTAFPTDGVNSINDSNFNAGMSTLTSATNSPTNYAGTSGTLALTSCLTNGTCSPCDDDLFCNGVETCSGSACVNGTACADICDEGADTCVECNGPSDCDDSNPCTDDSCNGSNVCVNTGNVANSCTDSNPCTDDACSAAGACVSTNNTDSCDDGLFCTTTDACSGGSCVGTGDACLGDQCLEGIDACGDCNQPSDCDDSDPCTGETCDGSGNCGNPTLADGTACTPDGDFCSGIEECQSGSCVSPGDPCQSDQICNETDNQCDALCGNGSLDSGEDCDDANTTDGDGCTDCTIDTGFDCMINVSPTVCAPAPDAGHDHDHDHDAGAVGGDDDAGASAGDGDDAGGGTQDASASGGDGDDSPGGSATDASTAGGGAAASEASDDSTCSCRLPGSTSSQRGVPLLLLGVALLLRRRRRRV
jgi:MYXO-CTERM domain-containing protein